jgi:ketosteroid isomerase-like protein
VSTPVRASEEVLAGFREGFECWNDGRIDEMAEMYREDAEFDTTAAFPGGSVYRGRADMKRFWSDSWEAWEGILIDPQEVLDVGDGRYVVGLRMWGKGRTSGIEVDQRLSALYTIGPDGRIERCKIFTDEAAAVAAARES